MRKILLIFCAVLLGLSISATELSDFLKKIEGVTSVEQLENGQFAERYVIMITQPLDHDNPSAGSFSQRFVVASAGADRPSLLITEGYGGGRALSPKYREEISRELNTNQIFVEHRYFEKSTPSPRDWKYMTGRNAAGDLHRIYTALKPYFSAKWVASGISKGGENTMIYNSYYPDDMDASVPYVGPVSFGVVDGRHEPFLEKVGTADERRRIRDFQIEVLERRDEIVPLFKEYCDGKKYKFRAPIEEVYDYCVLEYPFALWQWGSPVSEIPASGAPAAEMLTYLMKIAGADYFAINDEPSFFVQAARELGYYGYDTKPFKGLLAIKSSKKYLKELMLPDDALKIKFSRKLSDHICKYLKNNDPKMIFIYGEYDPWSAAMIGEEFFVGKHNMKLCVDPGGSHKARISTLPESIKAEVWSQLRQWLDL